MKAAVNRSYRPQNKGSQMNMRYSKKINTLMYVAFIFNFQVFADVFPYVEMRMLSQKNQISDQVNVYTWNVAWKDEGTHSMSNYLFCIGNDCGSDMMCFNLAEVVKNGLSCSVFDAFARHYPLTFRFAVGESRWIKHTQFEEDDDAIFWGACQMVRVELSDPTSRMYVMRDKNAVDGAKISSMDLNFDKKRTQRISKIMMYSNRPLPEEYAKTMKLDEVCHSSGNRLEKKQSVLKSGYIWVKLIPESELYFLHPDRFQLNTRR